MKLCTLALLPLLVLAGCKPAAKELKIGVSAPTTGSISATGQSAKNAIALVQDVINAGGGVQVGVKQV